jgi:multidrug resistance efflux pump
LVDDTFQLESLEKNIEIFEDMLDKKQKLYDTTKSISFNELQQLKIQYTNTKAELESLKLNEKKENIEYEISREVLNYYRLKSPVDGTIIRIEPKIGEWVQVGKEVVQIVNSETCYVEVDLTTDNLQQITLNSKVKIEVSNGAETVIKDGLVTFISPIADSSSALIRSKISFDNKDHKAIPGLSAKVILE